MSSSTPAVTMATTFSMHDVGGPLNVDAHAHDTNMLVDNDGGMALLPTE
jgi:hypothetical protein